MIDVIEDVDGIHLVTKYSEVSTLKEYLDSKSSENFGLYEVLAIVKEIAFLLEVLHSKGIVHRNLTPEALRVQNKNNQIYLKLENFDFAVKLW